MAAGLRSQRLADEMKDLIAGLFQGGILDDPRLKGITVTGSKLSPDLQVCYIYFRLYDPNQVKTALLGFEKAKGFLRKTLAENLRIRRIPELKFIFDESVERGENIERILARIKDEDEPGSET